MPQGISAVRPTNGLYLYLYLQNSETWNAVRDVKGCVFLVTNFFKTITNKWKFTFLTRNVKMFPSNKSVFKISYIQIWCEGR